MLVELVSQVNLRRTSEFEDIRLCRRTQSVLNELSRPVQGLVGLLTVDNVVEQDRRVSKLRPPLQRNSHRSHNHSRCDQSFINLELFIVWRSICKELCRSRSSARNHTICIVLPSALGLDSRTCAVTIDDELRYLCRDIRDAEPDRGSDNACDGTLGFSPPA